MSVKSRKSSRKVERPFDRQLLKRAAQVADQYQIIIHFEDGEYFGRGLELPNVMSEGRTPDACVAATRDALTIAVAYLLESGQAPPSPASEAKRSEQVNVRLTPEEKLMLEDAARRKGFRGISDFIRNASLLSTRS